MRTVRLAAKMPMRLILLGLLAANGVALKLGSATRRQCFSGGAAAAAALILGGPAAEPAAAFIAGKDEEVSGLVVLRVAEVCQFQEKLLRQLATCSKQKKLKEEEKVKAADQFGNAYCEGEAYGVNPIQISFGTGIMLRNANLDGNLKLMIRTEVPRPKRDEAATAAASIMNTFLKLGDAEVTYGVEFTDEQMLEVADVYASARQQLARFFDYLPKTSQDKFYNYNAAVTQYEQKELEEEGIERMKT